MLRHTEYSSNLFDHPEVLTEINCTLSEPILALEFQAGNTGILSTFKLKNKTDYVLFSEVFDVKMSLPLP